MTTFRVTIDGADAFALRCAEGGTILSDELTNAIALASFEGHNESKRIVQAAGRIDTAQLFRSIGVEPVTRLSRGARGGWRAAAAHTRFVIEGRRPGAPMPPRGALLPWMARKGIPAEREFLVRRAIARRGIPALDFLGDALERTRPVVLREVQAAVRRAIARVQGGAS